MLDICERNPFKLIGNHPFLVKANDRVTDRKCPYAVTVSCERIECGFVNT